jgi:hypothetical protein
MNNNIKLCITSEQAFQFKKLGVVQHLSRLVWGKRRAENSEKGDKGFYYLLFFRNEDGNLIFMCPERNYGRNFSKEKELHLEDCASAFTVEHLSVMLNMHLGDILYSDSGELLNQISGEIVPYSDIIFAMGDRVLINLTIGEYSLSLINDLLLDQRNCSTDVYGHG